MEDKDTNHILLKKYIDKTINQDELAQLNAFFELEGGEKQLDVWLQEYFSGELTESTATGVRAEVVKDRAWQQIAQRTAPPQKRSSGIWHWSKIAVAASLLLTLSVSLYFIKRDRTAGDRTETAYNNDVVKPGSNKATLRISGGKRYNLDGSKQEIVVGKSSIRYEDGELLTSQEAGQEITLSTPRGGQYRVTLSDGTKVWLNAASSLVYPANFMGKERVVQLTGEAFFEVTHNASQPFIVSTDGQRVMVLGTSFNVNAYGDEYHTVTTLLNGSVKLTKSGSGKTAQLVPGEQAILGNSGFDVGKVDAEVYAAWKDGEFRFKATPLISALRQIERWYDLDIDYTGIPDDIHIHASINRNKQLSSVIHALEKITDLKFDVKGRSVKLMK